MAGKYQKLRGKVPRFQEDSTYQEKINKWKQEFLDRKKIAGEEVDLQLLLCDLHGWKKQKKEIEKGLLYNANLAIIALNQMATEHMESAGFQKIELAIGGIGYLGDGVYPSIKDKGKFMEWVKKKKLTSMLTFPWQSLKGLVGERLAASEPLPSGVEAFLKTEVKFRGIPNEEEED